jgi:uncharacterized protein
MDMTGTQRINAPREAVYAALNDTEVLKQCIPGCESIEKLTDTQMRSTVTLKVGPVKASFKGLVTLSDLDPPNGYTITGEGSGGTAGFAKGSASIKLLPDGTATVMEYAAKADVGGRLAQLGGRLIDATANKLAGDFFEKFATIVGKPQAMEAEVGAPHKAGWLGKLFGVIATHLKGWLRKLFGSSAASLLFLGLFGNLGGLNGHAHAMEAAILPAIGTVFSVPNSYISIREDAGKAIFFRS